METDKIEFYNKATTDEFIYFNAFGVIFKDKVILNNNNRNINLNIINIKRVVMQKKRSFRWNMLIVSIFIFILITFFYFQKQTTLNDKIVAIAFSIIVTIAFFLIKEINYKLIVLLNGDKIEIKVKKEDKDQAKTLMSKINSIIKETKYNQLSA